MSMGWRLALLAVSAVLLCPAVWQVVHALPDFGAPSAQYGATINAIIPSARHVTNMVAAVNFDVRGIDTVGEECILVCAVTGTVVLLRAMIDEAAVADSAAKAWHLPDRPVLDRTDATSLVARAAAAMVLLFGIYMVLHGTATPGGGFQGGVIAASSLLLVYLGEGFRAWHRLLRIKVMDMIEGGGTLIFVGAAAMPLAFGYAALQNTLPYGQPKDLHSGGLIAVANLAVGISVFGSFGVLLIAFMEQTRARSSASDPQGQRS